MSKARFDAEARGTVDQLLTEVIDLRRAIDTQDDYKYTETLTSILTDIALLVRHLQAGDQDEEEYLAHRVQ